ncbi:glycosyltransferase family 1 protein, partial [Escherichia coli]|nr:glycosyltransferase family 1 protein [Escherichia coli]
MMKILFTESSPDIGGQELQALAQMTALQKQGHSVLLACREKSKIAHEARTIGHDVTFWICPYISRHLLSLNPLLACCR